ncbi:Nicotinate phosphoribosyltransferase [Aduncisulcus paluster]|uniref:Nicotinate phosphoribosyltransferase n=1 Tax=Aduncisulcus paluster TaxID=2918883 RepID=A0ABQ5JTA1_9EUKA|nr:Nicotinate phosphoribosyltransferase [Aduncisulcus paluster]
MPEDYKCRNTLVDSLLTDLYQITMAYAYWKNGCAHKHSVFEAFFRKNPFKGEFTIFAGLDEVMRFISDFKFTKEQLDFLKTLLPHAEDEFFEYLSTVSGKDLSIYAIDEGTIVFPRLPLIRVEGPLAVAQLVETTILNLINFPSLITTNAARLRLAAGADKTLLEFGLRRAQGPDGACSASKYSYLGGFDATSNVQVAKLDGIKCSGTHAHSFILAYSCVDELKTRKMKPKVKLSEEKLPSPSSSLGSPCKEDEVDFVDLVFSMREKLGFEHTNTSELVAFIAYAQAFPDGFLALVDTYNTLTSGVPNYLCVACALSFLGYQPIGVRLDSGDLAYLSKASRALIDNIADKFDFPKLRLSKIVASNDISEEVLHSLNGQGHAIDVFGIGTKLVTCSGQPALGCVYKLVEIEGKPRIKLSQVRSKMTLPCSKQVYRLCGKKGTAVLDLMGVEDKEFPKVGGQTLCIHPTDETRRVYVCPTEIVKLVSPYWIKGEFVKKMPTLAELKSYVASNIKLIREDHKRPLNPTPYKVSVSVELHGIIRDLWIQESPVSTLE